MNNRLIDTRGRWKPSQVPLTAVANVVESAFHKRSRTHGLLHVRTSFRWLRQKSTQQHSGGTVQHRSRKGNRDCETKFGQGSVGGSVAGTHLVATRPNITQLHDTSRHPTPHPPPRSSLRGWSPVRSRAGSSRRASCGPSPRRPSLPTPCTPPVPRSCKPAA